VNCQKIHYGSGRLGYKRAKIKFFLSESGVTDLMPPKILTEGALLFPMVKEGNFEFRIADFRCQLPRSFKSPGERKGTGY
jgi:hypothetical protein